MATETEQIYSVSELNRLSRQLLEARFSHVSVEGELHQVTFAQSGHWYFTLKDKDAQLRCAMFRTDNSSVSRAPEKGDMIQVVGKLGIYVPRGDYQLVVEKMEFAGAGELWKRYADLKDKLEAEGLFQPERKRPVPRPPQHIGIITSPTGAAIRDVQSVLRRRAPQTRLTLIPSHVQGNLAVPALCSALEKAQAYSALPFDVILLCRGGGSIEDLWAFNEEEVVRAVVASRIPVVCAVGHASDHSLCDFVADLTAPTPSAAAELLSEMQFSWANRLSSAERRLAPNIQQRLDHCLMRLDHTSRNLHSPVVRAIQEYSQKLDGYAQNAESAIATIRRRLDMRLIKTEAQLQALNPATVLERGYAVVSLSDGSRIPNVDQIRVGEDVHIQVQSGEIQANVVRTKATSRPGIE